MGLWPVAVALSLLLAAAPPERTGPVTVKPAPAAETAALEAEIGQLRDEVRHLSAQHWALRAVVRAQQQMVWALLGVVLLLSVVGWLWVNQRLGSLAASLDATAALSALERRIVSSERASCPETEGPVPQPAAPPRPVPQIAVGPTDEDDHASAAPDGEAVAVRLAERVDLPAEAQRLASLVARVRDLPATIEAALATGEVAAVVRTHHAELDRALFERVGPEAAMAALVGVLSPAETTALCVWLSQAQSAATRHLADLGLERVTTSPGSPFEEGRVVVDAEAPAVPTSRRELAGRVAGVRPGQGGWVLAGQVLMPTRAQPYEYRA